MKERSRTFVPVSSMGLKSDLDNEVNDAMHVMRSEAKHPLVTWGFPSATLRAGFTAFRMILA
jgi:hypothetical protein